MVLPKEISPNPLLTSTVEVRFNSKVKPNEVLSLLYPIFSKNFGKIENNSLPPGLKNKDQQFEFAPDYILSNSDYSLSFSHNSIAFENIGTYHFWPNYFPMIKENLLLLHSTGMVNSILRVGVRYASMFAGVTDVKKVLKKPFGIDFGSYSDEMVSFNTNLKKNNTNLYLQIIPNATSNKTAATGFYIDIDASSTGSGNLNIGDQLFNIIDVLHTEEKELFFSLLSDSFLKTLNPKY